MESNRRMMANIGMIAAMSLIASESMSAPPRRSGTSSMKAHWSNETTDDIRAKRKRQRQAKKKGRK